MPADKGFDMVLTGVGGQGIVMLSNAIGNACVEAGEKAITGELHGLSQRSGSIYIHMRVGGKGVSPLIPYGQADAIVALEAMEALRYIEFLKDDGVIIMNRRLIHPPVEVAQLSKEKRTDFITIDAILEKLGTVTSNIAPIDALTLAKEAGDPRTENSVFIGALSTLAAFPLSHEEMKRGLLRVLPEKAMDQNLQAFELGQRAAFDNLCQLMECREP
ncbi:MAG: indolepyruvate oxidoreductase subunit beta [Desulfobacteraceae bacterium]|nr:indolepyruvate oxidoreductase subunit beta [Desulfobacteraceae bacterium]